MMGTISLTKEHFDQIQKDMDERDHFLTDGQTNSIAQKVNGIVNLPSLDEEKEMIVMAKMVRLVDRALYRLIPNQYYEMVMTATEGITQEEAEKLEERLTPLLNLDIDFPVLSEKQEAKIIGMVMGLILNAMVKGHKLETARMPVEFDPAHNGN